MIRELFGAGTLAANLKTSLDDTTRLHRQIAGRVANASAPLAGDGFDAELQRAVAVNGDDTVDLDTEMTRLADNQLRFEATAKLLQKTYASFRTAMRNG